MQAACPLLVTDEASGGYVLSQGGPGACNGVSYMAFKCIPIPKLMVPTGLDPQGRPTAVLFWGRAPPVEKLYDDEFAKTFDLDFLYKVRPLVELLQADEGLRRKDAPLVANLFEQQGGAASSSSARL